VFTEDLGLDRIAFFSLADGTEGELVFGREGRARGGRSEVMATGLRNDIGETTLGT
jgi:hypothetical protein